MFHPALKLNLGTMLNYQRLRMLELVVESDPGAEKGLATIKGYRTNLH